MIQIVSTGDEKVQQRIKTYYDKDKCKLIIYFI